LRVDGLCSDTTEAALQGYCRLILWQERTKLVAFLLQLYACFLVRLEFGLEASGSPKHPVAEERFQEFVRYAFPGRDSDRQVRLIRTVCRIFRPLSVPIVDSTVTVRPWEEFWLPWLRLHLGLCEGSLVLAPSTDSSNCTLSKNLVQSHFHEGIVYWRMEQEVKASVAANGDLQSRFDSFRDWLKSAGTLKDENAMKKAAHAAEKAAEAAAAVAAAKERAEATHLQQQQRAKQEAEQKRVELVAARDAALLAQNAQQQARFESERALDVGLRNCKEQLERECTKKSQEADQKLLEILHESQDADSAHQQAEEALKAAEAAQQGLFDALPAAVELSEEAAQQVQALQAAVQQEAVDKVAAAALEARKSKVKKAVKDAQVAHDEAVKAAKKAAKRLADAQQRVQQERKEESDRVEAAYQAEVLKRRAELPVVLVDDAEVKRLQREFEHAEQRAREANVVTTEYDPAHEGPVLFHPNVRKPYEQHGYVVVLGVDKVPPESYLQVAKLVPSRCKSFSMKLKSVVLDDAAEQQAARPRELPEACEPDSVPEVFAMAQRGDVTLEYAKHVEYAAGLPYAPFEPDAQPPLEEGALPQPLLRAVQENAAAYSRFHAARGSPGADPPGQPQPHLADMFDGFAFPRLYRRVEDCLVWRDCTWSRPRSWPALPWGDNTAVALVLLVLHSARGEADLVVMPRVDEHSTAKQTCYVAAWTTAPPQWEQRHWRVSPPACHPQNLNGIRDDPRNLLSVADLQDTKNIGFDEVMGYLKRGNSVFNPHNEQIHASFVHHVIQGTQRAARSLNSNLERPYARVADACQSCMLFCLVSLARGLLRPHSLVPGAARSSRRVLRRADAPPTTQVEDQHVFSGREDR